MTGDALSSRLQLFREDPGVRAALLVSADGFLVASAVDDTVDAEAVAAQIAAVLLVGRRLADELGQAETRYVTFELTGLNVVVAPFEGDLLLVLVGGADTITITYTLRERHA